MMLILRSDMEVKLANRLLRTYSPGLLSGSMLMGSMAGGPFSPWGQLTGGMGGLLYPFPTGEAEEHTHTKHNMGLNIVKRNIHICLDEWVWVNHRWCKIRGFLRVIQKWTKSPHVRHSTEGTSKGFWFDLSLSFSSSLLLHRTWHLMVIETLRSQAGVILFYRRCHQFWGTHVTRNFYHILIIMGSREEDPWVTEEPQREKLDIIKTLHSKSKVSETDEIKLKLFEKVAFLLLSKDPNIIIPVYMKLKKTEHLNKMKTKFRFCTLAHVGQRLTSASEEVEAMIWYHFIPHRSSQDTEHLNIFLGMLSMCGNLLWLPQEASLIRSNSAPTQAFDEADDTGFAPAHRHAVHSRERGYGIQGFPESQTNIS